MSKLTWARGITPPFWCCVRDRRTAGYNCPWRRGKDRKNLSGGKRISKGKVGGVQKGRRSETIFGGAWGEWRRRPIKKSGAKESQVMDTRKISLKKKRATLRTSTQKEIEGKGRWGLGPRRRWSKKEQTLSGREKCEPSVGEAAFAGDHNLERTGKECR